VHPTGGSRRVFKQFVWPEVDSVKIALSRPTHQRVTQTVGLLFKMAFIKMKKYIEIFPVVILALLSANACVSTRIFSPTSIPMHTPQITPTHTQTPVIYPVQGYDVLLSPDGTKKAVYDAHLSRTFEVIDANETILWSITYDAKKFDLAEPWYKPFYWSKDGKFLYYTCFHGQETDGSSKFYGNEFIDGCGVFRLDVETGETIDILPEIAPGNGYYAFSISPDEQRLVYTNQNETPVRIKLLDMNTGQKQILLTANEDILETGRFGWSPEGDKLVFMTLKISGDEKRFYSIFILDLNSLETNLLVEDLDTRIRFVSWDEQDVISYNQDGSGSIWQLKIGSEIFAIVTITPWATLSLPTTPTP